jgi:hypothetical protein
MPTLQRRQDGAYFIRNYYHDYHTWQVVADGVRFLELRGATEGAFFSTDLFMQLYMNGWVFTGNGPRLKMRSPVVSALVPPALAERLQRFHQLLFKGQVDHIIPMLWWGPAVEDVPAAEAGVRQFFGLSKIEVKSWKLRDAVVHRLPEDLQSSVGGTSLAVVRAGLTVGATAIEATEHWFGAGDQWHVAWGFLHP